MQNDSFQEVETIDRIIRGDVNAFEMILKKYEKHVIKVVSRHVPRNEIEEIVHEVFIRTYKGISKFRRESSLKTWISSVAVRTCYDFWRKRYRSHEVPMSLLNESHGQMVGNILDEHSDSFQWVESINLE